MPLRIQDLLAQRAGEGLAGRKAELARLRALLTEAAPVVVQVHGMGGIGKTSLLSAFTAEARATGATVVVLDCREIEPTERAFLRELANAIGGRLETIESAADRIAAFDEVVVLALDTYEVFRTMDTWLRQRFIPRLPENARVVLCGREPPVSTWITSPGWSGLFKELALGPLDAWSAHDVLKQAGIGPDEAARINRVTRGHPLALQLAASVAGQRHESGLEGVAISRVVETFAQIYLADVDDPVARRALEAASVVRSVNVPLLGAMLPDIAPRDGVDRLRSLPFAEQRRDGIHIHDVVRQAVAEALRADDPGRYRRYRREAWRHLQSESGSVGSSDLWRYTADLLYILENPIVREAFFPSSTVEFTVEPSNPTDVPSILAISAEHEDSAATRLLEIHLSREPSTVWVIRSPDGSVAGFFTPFTPEEVSQAWMRSDPILRGWLEHLRMNPVPRGQEVMFVPRLLSREFGEQPSPVQAGAWLETKRMYMELKPRLRRVYFAQRDLDTPWPALRELGFTRCRTLDAQIGSDIYRTAVLDFGPSSVDGWLARLVGAELGVVDDDDIFDPAARELVSDGARVGLTRLEFEVMNYLIQHEGESVARATLLDHVWGRSYDGGSNVVDAIIRSLRKKLGENASMIETVRGTGYRFRRDRNG